MQVVFVDKALHLVGFLNTAYDAALGAPAKKISNIGSKLNLCGKLFS